jgi:endonuclease-3 related protein
VSEEDLSRRLLWCYQALLTAYGPQGWWPGEGPLEVLVGAVLTQNTSWRNVERALDNLRAAGVLSAAGLHGLPQEELERLLRPAGTYRVKAGRLRALLDYLVRAHGGDPAALSRGDITTLRGELLAVPGIGPETADSILLYAAGLPTFVVDAYTRRLLARLGWLAGTGQADGVGRDPAGVQARSDPLDPLTASYEHLRLLLLSHLPLDTALLGEYHALIVRHGKERCRKREPRCTDCPLVAGCAFGSSVPTPRGDAGRLACLGQ